jgi:hypothetical protein
MEISTFIVLSWLIAVVIVAAIVFLYWLAKQIFILAFILFLILFLGEKKQ